MKPIVVNSKFTDLTREDIEQFSKKALDAKREIYAKTGKGNDFLGWLDYPLNIDDELMSSIQAVADEIREKATVLVVVGIGGSYLGAKSAIECLQETFQNEKSRKNGDLAIYFLGQNLSPRYMNELFEHIKDESIYVNVISKSGTTTEPAVGFRFMKKIIEEKYGMQEASKRIIATTDAKRGALKELSNKAGYRTFVIPDDVGGRFSVITPVGLIPIASAGIDIREFVRGLQEGAVKFKSTDDIFENEALNYAIIRQALYSRGKKVEILVNYEPRLTFISEWWKQLYAESEGKEGKGIYPSSLNFTTDLHSVGQYVQQGERIMFETLIQVMNEDSKLNLELDEQNLDGLNYLVGKSLYEINQTALKATMLAHYDGGVPNVVLELEKVDAYHLGYLYSFFMHAVAFSGYMLGINPFDQPGVEDYKRNMFAMLGKPGYEELAAELLKKI